MNGTIIAGLTLKLLDGALTVAEMHADDRARLQAGVDKLKAMIREGRDPTNEEWAEVNKISDDLLADILARAGQST